MPLHPKLQTEEGRDTMKLSGKPMRARTVGAMRPEEDLIVRMKNEFLEMPGLKLTCRQAQRLFGLDSETCTRLLGRLVELRFLLKRPDGTYLLAQ
ncbi:MAG: hypothetical protein GEV06_25400 [Luteitalea sp.]|nr:hypothetical protein [Luteitalea sp.]